VKYPEKYISFIHTVGADLPLTIRIHPAALGTIFLSLLSKVRLLAPLHLFDAANKLGNSAFLQMSKHQKTTLFIAPFSRQQITSYTVLDPHAVQLRKFDKFGMPPRHIRLIAIFREIFNLLYNFTAFCKIAASEIMCLSLYGRRLDHT
jgi:hypothetical protein